MKKEIHPNLREVIFKDVSCDFSFKTLSTAYAKDNITWEDGKEYPLIKVDISSASHPFYTGKQRLIDTERGSIQASFFGASMVLAIR